MFAALKYTNTSNLGDDIQTIAAIQWLPKVDIYLNRDFLRKEIEEKNVPANLKLILNGWFSHNPSGFYPVDNRIKPLLISMHLTNKYNGGSDGYEKLFKDGKFKDWLIANGPVGCRDTHTLELLASKDIPSYFSGCLTTTLNKAPGIVEDPNLVCVVLDGYSTIPKEFENSFKTKQVSHSLSKQYLQNDNYRRDLAKEFLATYQSAGIIITSRLHSVLPCLAMGKNVVFTPLQPDDPRFTGWDNILRKVSKEELLESKTMEDLMSLRSGTNQFELNEMKENLKSRVLKYIETK